VSVERQHSDNVVWEGEALEGDRREQLLGHRGATVWFTGLPGSGKSTVAGKLVVALAERGVNAYRLDGDNLRHGLNGDLGFDHASRVENVRRTAEVARLMADAGLVAVVSLVSPYREGRDLVRALHDDSGLPFLEVWVSTPLEVCEQRDPKQLYARARRGEIPHMTGVGDPYEPPESPELEVPDGTPADAAVERLLALLAERGIG
jgi:adenylyl-sulfate kinase